MKTMIRCLDNYLEEAILACMMGYFVFATATQVLCRFVLHVSAPWTEETARYVLIWMTFLGAAYAAKKGIHIRVDILENAVGKYGKIVKYVSNLLFVAFAVIIMIAGIKICKGMITRPQYSSVLHIPLIYVYAAVPVGMFLTAFRTLQRIYREEFRKGVDKK